jgi:hypothetical protein
VRKILELVDDWANLEPVGATGGLPL